MRPASGNTGRGADTRRFVDGLSGAVARSNITPTKNTRSWKTYLGRPEADQIRGMAMELLGNGLSEAGRHADALTVKEAELSMLRRVGSREENVLNVQTNLASTHQSLGRLEEANRMLRDVYSGRLKLFGEEHVNTVRAAYNYAASLINLERYAEAKSLMRRTVPVARRIFGEDQYLTLMMRQACARALFKDPGATLDDLLKAVNTLVEILPTARRVFGGAHPLTSTVEGDLRSYRDALRASEKKFNLKLLDEKEDA